MTKKTKIASFACLSVLAVSVVAALGTKGLTKSTADGKWYHYDAVAATTKTVGSKEYWTDCNGTTVLTEPAGEIEEKGQPTQAFINKLALNDERRVAQIGTIDFEDESDLALFDINLKKSAAIVEDETATSGSHVLKIVANGEDGKAVARFRLVKSYLDKVFADPNVKGIYFDAKASDNYNNFRRYTIKDGTGAGATPYDMDNKGSGDILGKDWCTGLNTNWKTFCFERTFYQHLVDAYFDNWQFVNAEQLGADAELYFDNFRIASHGTQDKNYYGFETGTVRGVSKSDWRGLGYFRSSDSRYATHTGSDWGDWRFADDGTIDKISFDYNIKSEGNRSLKIEKTATSGAISMYLPQEFKDNCPGAGYLLDIYFSEEVDGVDVNATTAGQINGAVQCGNGIIESWKGNFYANKWNTVFIPKDKMDVNSNGYFRALRFAGSQCNGTFYIDNLRPLLGTQGFEDTALGNSAQNVEIAYNNTRAEDRRGGQNLRDYNDHVFYINAGSAVGGSITNEFATEGVSSLKYVQGGGSNKNFNIYFNKTFFGDHMNAAGISIDIMTPDGQITNFAGTQTVPGDGQWHTYTITKAEMNSLRASTHYCLAYNSSCNQGTYYFDNLQFLA